MSQAVPWTTYHGDQFIARGFENFGDAIQRGALRRQQQAQFDEQLAETKRAHDLGYYGNEADRAAQYYGIDTRARQAAAEMTNQVNPARVQPVPIMDPTTGQAVPGMFGIPLTGQIVQGGGDPNTAVPVLDHAGNIYGFKIQVGDKIDFREVKPDDPRYQRQPDLRFNGITLTPEARAQKQSELEKNKAELQLGDKYTGFDWWGGGNPRQAEIDRLTRELAQPAPGAPAATPATAPAQARTPPAPLTRSSPVEPALPTGPGGNPSPDTLFPGPQSLTPIDQEAAAWARSNPQDPRAIAILRRLGLQ